MKAAIFEAVGQPLVIDDVELDGPRAGEVLVKLHATGVCHTDMYTMSGADPSAYWPAVLGHEGGGEIVEVGPDVSGLAVGDHVVPFFKAHCGHCGYCLSPLTNQCQGNAGGPGLMSDGTARMTRGGEPLRHYMSCSTFAEYAVLDQIHVAKVDPRAPLDKVCLLGCGVTTGVGAALWTARVQAGSTCAVFGCGGVGMSVIQGCRLAGAARIIAVDLSPERLEQSKGFGATETLVGSGESVAAIHERTSGGVDYAFEATGLTPVMQQALESTRIGGGVCCVIGVAGKGEAISVVPRNLILGRQLIGSSFGGAKGRIHVPQLTQWYLDGKLDIDRVHTATLPLSRINEAFEMMERQDGFRTVIDLTAE